MYYLVLEYEYRTWQLFSLGVPGTVVLYSACASTNAIMGLGTGTSTRLRFQLSTGICSLQSARLYSNLTLYTFWCLVPGTVKNSVQYHC